MKIEVKFNRKKDEYHPKIHRLVEEWDMEICGHSDGWLLTVIFEGHSFSAYSVDNIINTRYYIERENFEVMEFSGTTLLNEAVKRVLTRLGFSELKWDSSSSGDSGNITVTFEGWRSF